MTFPNKVTNNYSVGAKSTLMAYCYFLRKYPSVHVFFVS